MPANKCRKFSFSEFCLGKAHPTSQHNPSIKRVFRSPLFAIILEHPIH